jgi:hypothetical protein
MQCLYALILEIMDIFGHSWLLENGEWKTILKDGHWDTKFMWSRNSGSIMPTSSCSISWSIGENENVENGVYRLRMFGTSKNLLKVMREYSGTSAAFNVTNQ